MAQSLIEHESLDDKTPSFLDELKRMLGSDDSKTVLMTLRIYKNLTYNCGKELSDFLEFGSHERALMTVAVDNSVSNEAVKVSLQVLDQIYVTRMEAEYFSDKADDIPLIDFAPELANIYHTRDDPLLRIYVLKLLHTLTLARS